MSSQSDRRYNPKYLDGKPDLRLQGSRRWTRAVPKVVLEAIEEHTHKWWLKMQQKKYVQVQTEFAEFWNAGFRMLEGPIGITLSGPVDLQMVWWVPKIVMDTWNAREDSAHGKAAWEAIKMNPKYVNKP